MIFNRVSGLDIGTSPDHIIKENIKRANAPVRYPFLWNAPVQDMTQWPGFAENGNGILGLARNVGEVYGVFGVFHPRKDFLYPDGVEYLNGSSLNMPGLMRLETLIRQIEPPKWQWAVDKELADAGKKIYDRECGANCHAINTEDAAKRICAKFHLENADSGRRNGRCGIWGSRACRQNRRARRPVAPKTSL